MRSAPWARRAGEEAGGTCRRRRRPPAPRAAQQSDPLEGIKDEDDIPDNYLSMFVDEAEASLDALTSGLLALEGGGSGGDLKSLLGTAHKIKGSAASVGLNRAAKLAHLMEDLFENVVASRQLALAPDDRCPAQVHRWAAPARGRPERRRPRVRPFRAIGPRSARGTTRSSGPGHGRSVGIVRRRQADRGADTAAGAPRTSARSPSSPICPRPG